jgi:hypothetical protein
MLGTRSDAGKVILGCPRKGHEIVVNHSVADEIIPAGVAVSLNSDVELVPGVDPFLIGISRGVSMNHPDKNSVTIRGMEVPLKLKDLSAAAFGTIEIEDYAELLTDGFDKVTVGEVEFVAQSGAAVLGEATFRANTSDEATAISLAAQINAHDDTKDLVVATVDGAIVTVTAKEKGTGGNSIVFTYSDEGADSAATISGAGTLEDGYNAHDYVVEGGAVFIDDATGMATEDDEGATESNWKYASGVLEGVAPQAGGESAPCALVNMVS